MKFRLNLYLFIFMLIPICLVTITYSAFNEEMIINGEAILRVDENIRITDIKVIEQTNEAYETYNNKFDKERTSMFVTLPNINSIITYEITITNNSNIAYDVNDIIIENYSNNSIKYEIDLNVGDIIEANTSKTFTVKFYYNITTLPEDITNTLIIKYEFVEHIDSYVVDTYDYTGKYETFIAPYDGVYKIELWGASGGYNDTIKINAETANIGEFTERSVTFDGGYGGYVSGEIILKSNQEIYVYVGEIGKRNLEISFNGGGSGAIGGAGYKGTYPNGDAIQSGYSGGGATDIRLVYGTWNNFESLKSRIMVAGGGGGATIDVYSSGGEYGYGGGLTAGSGGYYNGHPYVGQNGQGGTQTSGGTAATIHFNATGITTSGKFGIGGNTTSISSQTGASGGGGGYYGGGGASGTLSGGAGQGGGGGSSFISGHNGCDAITETSTESNITHTGKSIHYSGYQFTNTLMIDGNGYNWTTKKGEYMGIPSYDGTSIMTNNIGDGYAKITFIERVYD